MLKLLGSHPRLNAVQPRKIAKFPESGLLTKHLGFHGATEFTHPTSVWQCNVLMDISILNRFLLGGSCNSAACIIHALIFKVLKSNFNLGILEKCGTSVSLISVQRALSVLTLLRSPIRGLLFVRRWMFTPLSAVRRVVFWRHFPIYTSAWGASFLVLGFSLYILWFRLL